mmetsp:Transcript_11819/g.46142  ORF Transcript_11819/g.46142 Transcript_11819/m.46142 type:complete len:235 (+) Transcript_11819:1087-1791(+)
MVRCGDRSCGVEGAAAGDADIGDAAAAAAAAAPPPREPDAGEVPLSLPPLLVPLPRLPRLLSTGVPGAASGEPGCSAEVSTTRPPVADGAATAVAAVAGAAVVGSGASAGDTSAGGAAVGGAAGVESSSPGCDDSAVCIPRSAARRNGWVLPELALMAPAWAAGWPAEASAAATWATPSASPPSAGPSPTAAPAALPSASAVSSPRPASSASSASQAPSSCPAPCACSLVLTDA